MGRRALVAGLLAFVLAAAWLGTLLLHARGSLETLPGAALGLVEPAGDHRNVLVLSSGPEQGVAVLQLRGSDEPSPLVLFPLDLPVEVPGVGLGVLREALAAERPAVIVETIARYTGLDLHHYVEVDLRHLAQTGATGGVSVCVAGGLQELAAGDAAAMAGLGDVRGVATVRGLLAEVGRLSTLANPLRARQVVGATGASLRTDLAVVDVWQVAREAGEASAYPLALIEVPTAAAGGATHVLPEQAESIFQTLREGSPFAVDEPIAEEPVEESVLAASGEVDVLNGSTVSGAAGRGAQELRAHGFTVVEVGNAERSGVERTEVRHGPDQQDRARMIAAYLPGSVLVRVEGDLPRPTVVLGGDRAAAEPITTVPEAPETDVVVPEAVGASEGCV